MIENLVLAELRNLRRYAFCLLGNRLLSDMAVEAALDSVVSDVLAESGRAISRLDLYKSVNEAAAERLRSGNISTAFGTSLHSRLLRLPELQRHVAALHAVIGLSYNEIASLLSIQEGRVRQIYTTALLALRKQPLAVLIIEDEALIAYELKVILTKLGLTVAGTARNRDEALLIAGHSKPQLIIVDYKLREEETGVEVVKAIRESLAANVIYVTAYPEAVDAAMEKGDIVITKPFNTRAVERAVLTHLAA
jgi:CheY-like chemotaxis protein/DNA-directed RNA polymerase specialized sigma24 family protein